MKKIIITRGVPGSGKSTWANEYVKMNPGFYICCRDDYREHLFGLEARNEYKFTKAKEKAVSEAQMSNVDVLLSMPATKGVIIADTNLNPSTYARWEEYAKTKGHEFIIKNFHVPWTELLKRNQYRGTKAVPIDILRNFYEIMEGSEKYIPDMSRPDAVIFDLDGTLADNEHRSPYDLEKLGDDKPRPMVVMLLKMLQAKGFKILTVSGRESGTKEEPFKYKEATIKWLFDNDIHTDWHLQREQGDSRKDDIVKEEIFRRFLAPNYNIRLAVDDRAQVVEMWRRIGVECWQVNHGDF